MPTRNPKLKRHLWSSLGSLLAIGFVSGPFWANWIGNGLLRALAGAWMALWIWCAYAAIRLIWRWINSDLLDAIARRPRRFDGESDYPAPQATQEASARRIWREGQPQR